MSDMVALRAMTRLVLDNPFRFEWTVQGFGLLRLHMPGNARLHIWDHHRAYPGVSMIHDHIQWGLHSTVVYGQLRNVRFLEDTGGGIPYNYMRIKCGAGGGPLTETGTILLAAKPAEVYFPGQSYSQKPLEIHETRAHQGTVTVMQKYPSQDGETARVFWPMGQQWGNAEPRPATAEEIAHFVALARKLETQP